MVGHVSNAGQDAAWIHIEEALDVLAAAMNGSVLCKD